MLSILRFGLASAAFEEGLTTSIITTPGTIAKTAARQACAVASIK
jgi:hypothetical protein